MKFISNLYFNVFKRTGNMRLMFVVSCVFALICFFCVMSESSYRVKIIDINKISLQETLNSYSQYEDGFRSYSDLYYYVKIMTQEDDINKDKQALTYKIIVHKYCLAGNLTDAYNFAEQHFFNVGADKKYSDPGSLCKKSINKTFPVAYSLGYLWNYLWIIFWFYFPFLLVLPIRFIVEGYSQDKKDK